VSVRCVNGWRPGSHFGHQTRYWIRRCAVHLRHRNKIHIHQSRAHPGEYQEALSRAPLAANRETLLFVAPSGSGDVLREGASAARLP